jgi:hypothetical protein
MPQATEELRREWGIADSRAIKFLNDRGYKLTRDFRWQKPHPNMKPTAKELRAIEFLIQEWDFGGFDTGATEYSPTVGRRPRSAAK